MNYSRTKLYLMMLPSLLMAGLAYGKHKAEKKELLLKDKHPYIGFYHGRQLLDVSNNGFKQHTYAPATSGFIVRMPLVNHFKLEGGLMYSNILKPTKTEDVLKRKQILTGNAISLPITIQYYFRPETKRLRPFIGVGTLLSPFQQRPSNLLNDADGFPKQAGVKYISLLVTQGVTFAISTKIDVTESIHLMPEKDNTSIGFSVGIGFRVP